MGACVGLSQCILVVFNLIFAVPDLTDSQTNKERGSTRRLGSTPERRRDGRGSASGKLDSLPCSDGRTQYNPRQPSSLQKTPSGTKTHRQQSAELPLLCPMSTLGQMSADSGHDCLRQQLLSLDTSDTNMADNPQQVSK